LWAECIEIHLIGDFAETEGNYLSHNLFFENVLVASRLFARGYKGVCIIYHLQQLHLVFYFLFHFTVLLITILTYIIIYSLGITLSTTPRRRLLTNPPIEHTLEFEGWYIESHIVIHVNV